MEIIKTLIDLNYSDFIKSLIGFLFASVFILLNFLSLNLEDILLFSAIERIFFMIAVSVILGKALYSLGNTILWIVIFIIFQKNKKDYLIDFFSNIPEVMSFGSKKIKKDDIKFLRNEIYDHLENNIGVKKIYEKIVVESVFWRTLLGTSVVLFFLNRELFHFGIGLFIVSIFFCLINRVSQNRIWDDTVKVLSRTK